jgi:hypothetical protein
LSAPLTVAVTRAEVARELDRDVPDAAGAGMNQYRLARLEAYPVDERFPCGDQDQRHGGGLGHRHTGRLARAVVLVDDRVLGVAARAPAQSVVEEVHVVTGLEAADARTHRFHRPGAVAPPSRWRDFTF